MRREKKKKNLARDFHSCWTVKVDKEFKQDSLPKPLPILISYFQTLKIIVLISLANTTFALSQEKYNKCDLVTHSKGGEDGKFLRRFALLIYPDFIIQIQLKL